MKAHEKCVKGYKVSQETWNYHRWRHPLPLLGELEAEKRKQLKSELEKAEKIEPSSEFELENKKRRLLPSLEDKQNRFHEEWPESFDDVFVENDFQPYRQLPENSRKKEEKEWTLKDGKTIDQLWREHSLKKAGEEANKKRSISSGSVVAGELGDAMFVASHG